MIFRHVPQVVEVLSRTPSDLLLQHRTLVSFRKMPIRGIKLSGQRSINRRLIRRLSRK